MPARTREREVDLYPRVARWTKRHFKCFAVGENAGLRYGRVDVVGLRDVGGRLSGKSEVIAIEVKRENAAFAPSAGQASGYRVYSDRCYLAIVRRAGFTYEEISIASNLGIGLLAIHPRRGIDEVLTSPVHAPLEGLRLELLEKLAYSLCTICGSAFRRGESRADGMRRPNWSGVSRVMKNAVQDERGYVYWLDEVAERTTSGRDAPNETGTHRFRRYLCPDCVFGLFGKVVNVPGD